MKIRELKSFFKVHRGLLYSGALRHKSLSKDKRFLYMWTPSKQISLHVYLDPSSYDDEDIQVCLDVNSYVGGWKITFASDRESIYMCSIKSGGSIFEEDHPWINRTIPSVVSRILANDKLNPSLAAPFWEIYEK